MGRYVVVEAPAHQPGVDYVTGTSEGPFIDTGRDITIGERKFGRIYLAESTIREMARELGMLGGLPSNEALATAYTKGKLDGLRETLGGDVHRIVDVLERWLASLRNDDLAAVQAAVADQGSA